MIRSALIKSSGIVMLATLLGFASCKGENTEQQADSDTEVIGDSINPTGSDGLGREIDTVEQIERSQQDTITPAP